MLRLAGGGEGRRREKRKADPNMVPHPQPELPFEASSTPTTPAPGESGDGPPRHSSARLRILEAFHWFWEKARPCEGKATASAGSKVGGRGCSSSTRIPTSAGT